MPDFVAIPTDVVLSCAGDKKILGQCCTLIRETFPKKLYAVRSSALTEDGGVSSMAGQFQTRVSVKGEEIEDAFMEIMHDAESKLKKLSLFSIIVQEFIELDYSGVCFTRNPN